jgi:hypothetical protein
MRQIDARYIALLHHDDICRPDLLERWLNVARRHVDVAFVFNDYGVFQTERTYRHNLPERIEGHVFLHDHMLRRWSSPVRGTALIRKDCWAEVGGMREQFGLLADIDLWMRLSARWAVGHVNEPLIMIRQERPADYPKEYKVFSWRRQRLLYEIHGAAQRENSRGLKIVRSMLWWRFRMLVTLDVIKWLVYAVVKRRRDIVMESQDAATALEMFPSRVIRLTLLWISR